MEDVTLLFMAPRTPGLLLLLNRDDPANIHRRKRGTTSPPSRPPAFTTQELLDLIPCNERSDFAKTPPANKPSHFCGGVEIHPSKTGEESICWGYEAEHPGTHDEKNIAGNVSYSVIINTDPYNVGLEKPSHFPCTSHLPEVKWKSK